MVPTMIGNCGLANVTLPFPPSVRNVSVLITVLNASEVPILVSWRFMLSEVLTYDTTLAAPDRLGEPTSANVGVGMLTGPPTESERDGSLPYASKTGPVERRSTPIK